MRLATRDDFAHIIASAPVAAIHFDAAWDGHRDATRAKMLEAQAAFVDRAAFAEVDVDKEGDLAKAIPVLNVPLVAYYRDGKLVAAKIGAGQDVLGRLQQVWRGEPLR